MPIVYEIIYSFGLGSNNSLVLIDYIVNVCILKENEEGFAKLSILTKKYELNSYDLIDTKLNEKNAHYSMNVTDYTL